MMEAARPFKAADSCLTTVKLSPVEQSLAALGEAPWLLKKTHEESLSPLVWE